jgi:hypothetical protein
MDTLEGVPQEHEVQPGIFDLPAFYLETYQKDSIWNEDGQPIKPFVGKQMRNAQGVIAAHGRRYQVSRAELGDVAGATETSGSDKTSPSAVCTGGWRRTDR